MFPNAVKYHVLTFFKVLGTDPVPALHIQCVYLFPSSAFLQLITKLQIIHHDIGFICGGENVYETYSEIGMWVLVVY